MGYKVLIFIYYLVNFNSVINGQTSLSNDSVVACEITNDFFNWYLGAINHKPKSVFQPKFIDNKEGMTTLDFRVYLNNLKKHHCSDVLIEREKESYNECLRNLEKIKFIDFILYEDLGQIEDISCDFENYYRWIGGQEPIDGIRIKEVKQIDKSQIQITIDYFVDNSQGYGISYWGKNIITLVKIHNRWEINVVNWRD